MNRAMPALLDTVFQQVESQVQFGDAKASLLVAGDAVLIAVGGGVIELVADCVDHEFNISCMAHSPSLAFASAAMVILLFGLVLALLAARPARIHSNPPEDLFLLSHIARMDRDAFTRTFADAATEDVVQQALSTIHGKATYASRKFLLLRRSIDATLAAIGLMAAGVVASFL